MNTKRIVALACWLSVLALILVPGTAWLQENVTLTIDELKNDAFPDMQAFVTVSDANGVPIQGLGTMDFTVLEDGKQVTITEVSSTQAKIAVALVIDVSGSMRGEPLTKAKEAAISFLDKLGPEDEAAIIAFGESVDLGEPFPKIEPTKELDFTTDKGALTNLVNGLEAKKLAKTPLYDAAFKAVKMTARRPLGKKAVVLFTDGREKAPEERASIMEPDDPITEANRNRIPIYTIGLGENIDPEYLQRVALRTGGTYNTAAKPEELTGVFESVAEQLKQQYVIKYRSEALADQKEHTLLLKVKARGSEAQDEEIFLSKAIAPTISLPPIGEVRDKVTLTPQISAHGGVDRVEYLVDGELKSTATAAPYSYELDPLLFLPGDHTLTIKAYDPAGNVATQEFGFSVVHPQVLPPAVIALAGVLVLLLMAMAALLLWQRRRPMPAYVGPPVGMPEEATTEAGVFRVPEAAPPPERPLEAPYPEVAPEVMPGVGRPEPTISLRPEVRHLAWLIVEKGERQGKEFRLHEGDTTIGRAGTNDIILSDPTVSRDQAKVRLEGDEFYIYDLAATNPTKVNGQEITKHRLLDGDRVEVGNTVLVFKRA